MSGIVTYKGSPLANGAVLLSPVSTGQGRPAQGVIGSRGEFVISTFEPGDGVVPGDYSIAIVSTIPGTEPLPKDKGTGVGAKSAIPKKYGDPTKSELKESFAKGDAGKRLSLELTD